MYLNQSNNTLTIGVRPPGLVRDQPFGFSDYNFSIQATNLNGTGVVTYAPVTINVLDSNNKGPIPTVSLVCLRCFRPQFASHCNLESTVGYE